MVKITAIWHDPELAHPFCDLSDHFSYAKKIMELQGALIAAML